MREKFTGRLLNGRVIILLMIIVFLPAAASFGEGSPKKKVKRWQVDLSISPYYDSNILKYSDKYIQRFLNREDEGRFQINRYDDMVLQFAGGVSYENRFIKKLKTIFSVDAWYNRYSFNNVKDWTRFRVGWRQYFYKKSYFSLTYSYIPHFYVRHFRDEDWINVYGYIPITFQPYEFSKDDISFWIQHYIFKKTRIRLYASYYKYFLDKNNTEYDSDDYMLGIRLFQTLTKNITVDAGYKYYKSIARGYDGPGETKATSDDVDADNYSHDYFAGITYKLPKVLNMRNSISADVNYERTFFTTNNFYEVDPIHAGRHDKVFDLNFEYRITLPGGTDVSAFYSLTTRKTGTPAAVNSEYISDEKSYNQYQTGLKISYSFKF